MNTTQRTLPYVRQYVVVAIYEVLEQYGVSYEKTDSSTVISEIPGIWKQKRLFYFRKRTDGWNTVACHNDAAHIRLVR